MDSAMAAAVEEGEIARPLMEEREHPSSFSSLVVVVMSTAVAVSGSFEFGSAVCKIITLRGS